MGRVVKSAGTLLAGMCLVGGLAVGSAHAQMVDGKSPEAIMDVLKGFGSARLETAQSNGNPKISGRADGKAYEVYFYGCDGDKANCSSIQFWAYWDHEPTLETINGWNKDTRYGKIYLDQDNDVVLEYDVNLLGGVSVRTLEDNADIWVQLLGRVEKNVISQ